MAFINADRIKETTTTTGTGPLTLAGAVVGFRSFLLAPMATNDTCSYAIVSATGLESEAGIGTFTSPNILTRTTVQSSSNGNAAVNFSAGVKDVFIGPIAGTQVPYDPVTGTLGLGVNALNDVAITSPTVNQVLKYSGTEWTNQADAVNVGTVTSVSGAGTVSGLTLTGTVTASGSLTLGGTLSAIPLATGVSGTLPVANGGTGVTTSTGTTNVVLSNSPTLVTPLSNTLNAVPVVSGLTASVTAASSSSGILTYTATNTFTVGRTVSVTGLGITSGTTLNIAGMTIATASATQFTVVNATIGVSSGTGTATAGGNTLADAASNAVTAGPGGNRVIKAGDGVGVGKGGDIILQPGVQGSSGGNGAVLTTGLLIVNITTGSATINQGNTRLFVLNLASDYTINEWQGAVVSRNFITPRSYIEGSGGDIVSGSRLGFQNTGTPSPNNAATQMAVFFKYAMRGVMGLWGIPTAYGAESGGSFHFPSTTTAIAANTNDLALTASAFQRLNCTAASNLTGVAPPSGGAHVDGRMIRVYNVGTANLTLTHNSALSVAANRYWNSTAADIVLAPNDYAELIYDIINNGSGAAGWRAS